MRQAEQIRYPHVGPHSLAPIPDALLTPWAPPRAARAR